MPALKPMPLLSDLSEFGRDAGLHLPNGWGISSPKRVRAKDSMTMQNENNTSGLDCACESWIVHWSKYAGSEATHCSVDGCDEDATDGAHVSLPKADDALHRVGVWIAPMCHEHNTQFGQRLMSKVGTMFVCADPVLTCEIVV